MKKSHVRLVNHCTVSDLTITHSPRTPPYLEKKCCSVNGSVHSLWLMQVIGNGQDEESILAGMISRKKRKGIERRNLCLRFEFSRVNSPSLLPPADRDGLISVGFGSDSYSKTPFTQHALERFMLSCNWIFIKRKQQQTDTKRRIQCNSTWLDHKSSSIPLSPLEPVYMGESKPKRKPSTDCTTVCKLPQKAWQIKCSYLAKLIIPLFQIIHSRFTNCMEKKPAMSFHISFY